MSPWRLLRWWGGSLLREHPGLSGGLLLLLVAGGLVRSLQVWALGQMLDTLWRAGLSAGLHRALALFAATYLAEYVLSVIHPLFSRTLSHRAEVYWKERVAGQAASSPLELHESPGFHDRLEQARMASGAMSPLLEQGGELLRHLVSLAGYAGYLFTVHPWFPAVYLLATLPVFLVRALTGTHYTALLKEQTADHRRLAYLGELMTGRATADEAALFGLRPHLIDRWAALADRLRRERLRRVLRHQSLLFLFSFGTIGVTLAGFLWAARGVTAGLLTVGALAGSIETLIRTGSQAQQTVISFGRVQQGLLMAGMLHRFLHPAPAPAPAVQVGGPACEPVGAITFERVGFTYPGAERPVLTDLSFTLRAGERLALVGSNGAGKSTLAALLLGLYQPTTGRILVDGVDRQQLGREAWQARCSAIFQEFGRYEFPLRENLVPGEGPPPPPAVLEALGIHRLLAALPQGLDTPLGRQFGGRDLSLGQWQAVAIGRALAKPASLLVMDEPTAALDPRIEVEVYRRVLGITPPETLLLLISHRMGACRLAGRILVLDGGRLVEDGPHEELIARHGTYHALYEAQAHWYR